MRHSSFAHSIRSRVVLGLALAVAAPCLAQATPAPQASAATRIARDDVVAFAKVSLSVAQVRDSVQKQLAQPRNKTPQAQQQLREQLASGIEEVLHHAGMS